MWKHGMNSDLDGRKPKNAVRRIIDDLLDGKHLEVLLWNGNKYRIRGLTINDPDYDFSDLPIEVELEYYDMASVELFSDLVIVRRIDGTKTHWRGFNMQT